MDSVNSIEQRLGELLLVREGNENQEEAVYTFFATLSGPEKIQAAAYGSKHSGGKLKQYFDRMLR